MEIKNLKNFYQYFKSYKLWNFITLKANSYFAHARARARRPRQRIDYYYGKFQINVILISRGNVFPCARTEKEYDKMCILNHMYCMYTAVVSNRFVHALY